MKNFEKSKWIWLADGESADQYVEFYDTFEYVGGDTAIKISCDSDYTLFINGKYVASGQYGDFEHYKIYDELDLNGFTVSGKNEILILAYHCGVGTSRYRPAAAGLIYEVVSNENILTFSDASTLSRQSPFYESGKQVFVSTQLGFTFFYDAMGDANAPLLPSAEVHKNCELFPRPIKKHVLLEKEPIKTLTKLSDTHFLIDLGGETVGLPTLDIVSDIEQTVTFAWGEHITDGGVRKQLGNRNFFFEYKTKAGRNEFTEYMLRIGCRYIEIFSEAPINVIYAGVIPQVYEIKEQTCTIQNELDRRIYDACVNTLRLCMMEHYVDCPWREQALYAFDSRNQMLCGYYAFENSNQAYARSNLKLIGEDRRNDGLLSICYPCGTELAIPSFSLHYIIAMNEYAAYTGDLSLAREKSAKMKAILDEFIANADNGLIHKFEGKQMWNFYDWSPYADGTLVNGEPKSTDLAVNCLFLMALDAYKDICRLMGEVFPYPDSFADDIRNKVRETFLCENGLFAMSATKEGFTVLGNSLAILASLHTQNEGEEICKKLTDGSLIDCSLSTKVLEYEALLSVDQKYAELILSEIRKNYSMMLDAGSDTVWETLKGESDFANAGSLCHGWSSVPVYFYHKLGICKNQNSNS